MTLSDVVLIWIFLGPVCICLVASIGIGIGVACGKKIFKRTRDMLETTLYETNQSYPRLATQLADISQQYEIDLARYLETKKHPAVKSAEEIRRISKEKRELAVRCKMFQYQLQFYENLFPWLEDFKEVPIQEAVKYADDTYDEEYDEVRKWLSPAEYKKLRDVDKYQLAFDRWKQRRKNAWEIGIEYERYIGYLLEKKGFRVKYLGATLGVEDMGRDLLATKENVTFVVQCKRWAKEKTIHEKHIFQLHGSVTMLECQHPHNGYNGLFVTSTTLSELAKKCANYLGVDVVENHDYAEYPMIKCNISKNGEKIYHLPFDQQYDRVEIAGKCGAFYAWTTKEAETAGFRRAYRWHPDK